jgi:hypothetical protein
MNQTAALPAVLGKEFEAAAPSKSSAWLFLFGRMCLFLAVQAVFALGFFVSGSSQAWEEGANWWPIVVSIANFICLAGMIAASRREGKNYWDLFRIRRETIKGDLLVLLVSFLVIGPAGYFPNPLLAKLLFGGSEPVLALIIRPLPMWAAYASLIFFPITQGLVELALYFGFVMPRLSQRRFPNLLPVLLPALMLGFQHAAIPLLFNTRFIAWRALMFIPFALLTGLLLHYRPRLLPYAAVIHVLMDMSFATMLLGAAY